MTLSFSEVLITETSKTIISELFTPYDPKDLINESTCFKSLENPTCIDLILTNWPKCFQNSNIFETKLSNFHKFIFYSFESLFPETKTKGSQIQKL